MSKTRLNRPLDVERLISKVCSVAGPEFVHKVTRLYRLVYLLGGQENTWEIMEPLIFAGQLGKPRVAEVLDGLSGYLAKVAAKKARIDPALLRAACQRSKLIKELTALDRLRLLERRRFQPVALDHLDAS